MTTKTYLNRGSNKPTTSSERYKPLDRVVKLVEFIERDGDYPIVICEDQSSGAQFSVLWEELPEITRLLGTPRHGAMIRIFSPTGALMGARGYRTLGANELFTNYKDDQREGLSYIVASTNKTSTPVATGTKDNTKMLGVPGHDVLILADETEAVMKGGPNHRIISSAEAGNIITGPISFSTSFTKMRFNGLWTLNPLIQSTIPSTIVTPLPTMIFSPPSAGLKGIASTIKQVKEILF